MQHGRRQQAIAAELLQGFLIVGKEHVVQIPQKAFGFLRIGIVIDRKSIDTKFLFLAEYSKPPFFVFGQGTVCKVKLFKKDRILKNKFTTTLIFTVIIFALSITLASTFSKQHFFSMASKILISNFALMNPDSPAKVLERVNHQICLSNRAEMFVTTWLGILEISTGILRAANAGHEYPVIRRRGGQYELYRDRHGFVLGGLDGVRYKEYEMHFGPDDLLFLYTGGVTEATEQTNELFGDERLLKALNKYEDRDPRDVLDNLKKELDIFVGNAPQFDDITMLCLRYRGEAMKKLTIDATVENLEKVLAFVDAELEAADCPLKTQMQIDVAVEEIFVNIAHYAYAPDTGKAVIGVTVAGDPATAKITFSDTGMPYNPMEKEDPDVTLSAEEREIGGLGIFMVKKSMDTMDYEYRNGQNMLTMTKKI